MVGVAPGPFWFGADGPPPEGPPQLVYLGGFCLDRLEVTQAEYARCVAAAACPAAAHAADPRLGGELAPVVGVSWFDAGAYCAWRGGRLPGEREWEKAARGVRRVPPAVVGANLADPADGQAYTAPVGSSPSDVSDYGVFDLGGNAAEWTADAFMPRGGPAPAADRDALRAVRGGSWRLPPAAARLTWRGGQAPGNRALDFVSFRCARDPHLAPTGGP
jgi:formylglycine-generating enzyme required for sulfatase activity